MLTMFKSFLIFFLILICPSCSQYDTDNQSSKKVSLFESILDDTLDWFEVPEKDNTYKERYHNNSNI